MSTESEMYNPIEIESGALVGCADEIERMIEWSSERFRRAEGRPEHAPNKIKTYSLMFPYVMAYMHWVYEIACIMKIDASDDDYLDRVMTCHDQCRRKVIRILKDEYPFGDCCYNERRYHFRRDYDGFPKAMSEITEHLNKVIEIIDELRKIKESK